MAAAQPSANLKPVFAHRAVCVCLIQGLLQLIVALIAIEIIDGNINISSISHYNETFSWPETTAFMTYWTYFRDNCTIENGEPGWSCKAPATNRTHFWIIYYLAMDTVWVITSMLLLVFVPHHKKVNTFGQIYRSWWIIVTAIVIFSDVAVSIQYLLDLAHTRNTLEYFHYIGLKANDTVSTIPSCMKTAYVYVPPILMSLIFSRGIVGWMLTLIVLISATKHFRRPKPVSEVKTPDKHLNNGDENSARNGDANVASCADLGETAPCNSSAEQSNYIPWMNVLYLPSIYEEGCSNDTIPEYYNDHHYEHVIGPTNVPAGITIALPSAANAKSEKAASSFDAEDDDDDDQSKKTNPKLIKIDVGNVCIQINQRSVRSNSAHSYRNMKFLKIPRVSLPNSETGSSHARRAFNFKSAQDDELHPDT